MNTSPQSKRIKLDVPPPPNDENPKEGDDPDQEHCTICLQSFLDRTIVPVCAHEFCFECILLWSEQSRKCPLCSRSFDNSHLIHHIRSQYDYQKHYLPPLRSSSLPPLTGESRTNALRSTRRERQWGRRQRQQREEADQLERAIARRRWIYHHHLYAKHIASNPYTRYRPFPTPSQFAASPDLISRMTTFLRRELHVWPNLDVEFLTTYTISLMKSIDIRSESAVKLLSEFLDLDTPYTAGERHVYAEQFAHEIYSYLRSPYRDLNTYDQTAQYDSPPEISPPEEIERGRRWSTERSPFRRSRSRSSSGYRSSVPCRENGAILSPAASHGRGNSAEARCEDRPSRRHSRSRSPRGILPDREDHDLRSPPFGRRHSPSNSHQDFLRNSHPQPERMSCSEASTSAVPADNEDDNSAVEPQFQGVKKGKCRVTEIMEESLPPAGASKTSAPQGDDSAAVLAFVGEVGVTHPMDDKWIGDDYVDKICDDSTANPQLSRKRSAGLGAHRDVHPHNRTLSGSIRAYLSRPAVQRPPTKKPSVSWDEQPRRTLDTGATSGPTTDAHPLRLTDGPTDPNIDRLPHKTSVGRTVNVDPSTPNDTASEQQYPGCHSQSYVVLSDRSSSSVVKHADATIQRSDRATQSHQFLPSADHNDLGVFSPADPSHGRAGFPPVLGVTPSSRNEHDATLSHALVLEGRPASRQGESINQGHHIQTEMRAARGTSDRSRPDDGELANSDVLDLRVDLPGRCTLLGGNAASASLDNLNFKHGHGYGGTNKDTCLGVVSTSTNAARPSFCHGGERAACETAEFAVGGRLGNGALAPGLVSTLTSSDADALELETRLRARARLRMRLAAIKGTGSTGSVGPISESSPGIR